MNVNPSLLRPKTSASLRQHQLVSGCSCGKWSSIVRGQPAIINETTALQDTRSVMHGINLSMCSRGRVDNCRNDDVRQGSMFLNGGYQPTTTAIMWLSVAWPLSMVLILVAKSHGQTLKVAGLSPSRAFESFPPSPSPPNCLTGRGGVLAMWSRALKIL
jgi:hypothetical protein